jgi:glycosyltransferase involved in cell wall biosynthesis
VNDVVRRAHARPRGIVVDDGRPVLIAVGELSPAKGHDLLRAVSEVHAQGHLAQLVILGEGPERARLEQLAADLGIVDSVRLPGFFANHTRRCWLRPALHLVALGGFPLCVLEAMALGIPIVATDTDSGGPRTLPDRGRLGAMIPPNSVEAMTEAVVRHLERPEVLCSRTVAGPAHVRRLTPAATAAACRDVFVRVADPSPAGKG